MYRFHRSLHQQNGEIRESFKSIIQCFVLCFHLCYGYFKLSKICVNCEIFLHKNNVAARYCMISTNYKVCKTL